MNSATPIKITQQVTVTAGKLKPDNLPITENIASQNTAHKISSIPTTPTPKPPPSAERNSNNTAPNTDKPMPIA
ncbi:hypothetical protein [Verminephrobacter aporrectodeae]|uniref:hypothetical protein n=1 Tax=Verminephrobacter aporrectodeae TaxID=1110389 RepID=UPI00223772F7|nr:hypothetical protein [Verminephrobacter aporrectodeae]